MMAKFALADCNNFFSSSERVFDPSLAGVPLVVLSNNTMGAALHEKVACIKDNGVQVLSSNYTLYGGMSARVMSTLRGAVPHIELYSIDEAFLGLPEEFGEREAMALGQRVL